MKNLLLPLAIVFLIGCSSLHSVTYRTYKDPITGYTNTEQTIADVHTLFDGSAQLTKFANRSSPVVTSNGMVYAPGTYILGLDQNSSTSNLVLIIPQVAGAVVQGVVTGVK